MRSNQENRKLIINALQRTWEAIAPDLLGDEAEGNTFPRDQVQNAVVSCLHMAEETDPAAYKWFQKQSVSERITILNEAFPLEVYGW
jgi:hypothetical protein